MDRALFVGPLDRVLMLRTLPMLEGLEPIYLAAIAQHARERFFPAGTVLQSAKDLTESVHLIVEGELEVRHDGGPARRAGAGEAVGFVETLSRSAEPLDVSAVTDAVTLEFDSDAQLDVCEEHFPVLMQYLGYLARSITAQLKCKAVASFGPVPLIAAQAFGPELNFIERVLVLSRSRAFSAGCLDALCELAQHVTERTWKNGERLWSAGDPADNFCLLVSGSIRCSASSEELFLVHAGRVIGMYEALGSGERWFEAQSIGLSTGLRIDSEPFIDILEDHADLALDVMALLANEFLALRRFHGLEAAT
jgi:CRP-like cAMP-binding protein